MNYVVGYFLIIFKNEELAYRCFAQLLEKHSMNIFLDNFSYLQGYFYILDRMISLYIPDLWEHFKEERVMPVFYCSGWFITMFTNSFQYTEKSYLATWVVDFTVAEGMPGLFKSMIVLLKYLRFKFVKLGFDQIMNYLSDLSKKEVFTNVLYDAYLKQKEKGVSDETLRQTYIMHWEDFKFLNCFRERVNSLVLSASLIHTLQEKYNNIKKRINSKL